MVGKKSLVKTSATSYIKLCALCLIGVILASAAFFSNPAFASDPDAEKNSSTNGFGFMIGNDLVWTGESSSISGQTIANDILAAGRNIQISDTKVGGSLRLAAQNISIDNSKVTENITIAGETLSVDGGSANAVLMTGRTAQFTGSCSELHLYGNNVVINGTVHGDAKVAAESVEIGPNAVVEGTLDVSASAEPNVPSTAKIGKINVQIGEGSQASNISTEEISEALKGLSSTMTILGIVATIAGTLLIAVLAEWLFKRHTAAAAEMIRTRTGATIGTGVIAALVAPIAVIILCCLVISFPVAAALALALFAMTVVAAGFMGASVFKLAFKKLGRFQTALAGGAIMGVACAIPILGGLVTAVAFMYLLGYVLQTIFLSIRKPANVQPIEAA